MTSISDRERFASAARRLDPDGVLVDVRPLIGGLSAQVDVMTLRHGDGRIETFVVRRINPDMIAEDPHAAQLNLDVLTVVQSAGVLAPRVYDVDESGTIFPTPYLVLQYIEGQPDYTTADLNDYARQAAGQLARIHSVDGSAFAPGALPSQAEQLRHRILASAAPPDDSIGEGPILDTLRPAWPLPQANQPVLLHGDYWPGNMIWRDGQLVGVIDWEFAKLGEPLADVASARLDLLWIFGWDMVNAFTQAYRILSPIDFTQLPYWDLVVAIRPAHEVSHWAEVWPSLGRFDITPATMRRDLRSFTSKALAVIANLS